jgi:hypothetical protein
MRHTDVAADKNSAAPATLRDCRRDRAVRCVVALTFATNGGHFATMAFVGKRKRQLSTARPMARQNLRALQRSSLTSGSLRNCVAEIARKSMNGESVEGCSIDHIMLHRHRAFARALAFVLISSLAFAARSAHAFFDPPWITPAAPRAGETVSVNIRGGICDAIFFKLGYPQITQTGNDIRIIEYGHHWDTFDLCTYDIGTLTGPVGAFPPGDYSLTVDFVYDDALYGPTIVTLGVVPFNVAGVTSARPVPAASQPALFALFLIIFGLAFWSLRIRLRSRR